MAAIGVVFQPSSPPEALLGFARAAESAGVPELWLWEDCFRESGIASAAAALAVTERLRLGLGVLPLPLRNVALTAMELATLARLFPGRLVAGVGHGVLPWMGQIGARVASPLTLMDEAVPALRDLLAGRTVTVDGRYVHLDAVALDWPPTAPLAVYAAGEGPKTLARTGALADGTVIPAGWSPLRLAEAVAVVRAAAGPRATTHPVVVYLPTAFGDDDTRIARDVPDGGVAAVGDPAAVARLVGEYAAVGATTVVLQPAATEPDLLGFAERAGAVARLVDATPAPADPGA